MDFVFQEAIRIVREILKDYHKVIIEVAALLLVWWLFKRERKRLQETIGELTEGIDTLKQEVIADKDERQDETSAILAQTQAQPAAMAPAFPTPPQPLIIASIENWQEVRAIWSETKRRIQRRISQIKHGGTRKKYSKFSRNSYIDIIDALLSDRMISGTTRDKLLAMNQRFLGLRRRVANTTTADLDLFRRLLEEIGSDLPPDDKIGSELMQLQG